MQDLFWNTPLRRSLLKASMCRQRSPNKHMYIVQRTTCYICAQRCLILCSDLQGPIRIHIDSYVNIMTSYTLIVFYLRFLLIVLTMRLTFLVLDLYHLTLAYCLRSIRQNNQLRSIQALGLRRVDLRIDIALYRVFVLILVCLLSTSHLALSSLPRPYTCRYHDLYSEVVPLILGPPYVLRRSRTCLVSRSRLHDLAGQQPFTL